MVSFEVYNSAIGVIENVDAKENIVLVGYGHDRHQFRIRINSRIWICIELKNLFRIDINMVGFGNTVSNPLGYLYPWC